MQDRAHFPDVLRRHRRPRETHPFSFSKRGVGVSNNSHSAVPPASERKHGHLFLDPWGLQPIEKLQDLRTLCSNSSLLFPGSPDAAEVRVAPRGISVELFTVWSTGDRLTVARSSHDFHTRKSGGCRAQLRRNAGRDLRGSTCARNKSRFASSFLQTSIVPLCSSCHCM